MPATVDILDMAYRPGRKCAILCMLKPGAGVDGSEAKSMAVVSVARGRRAEAVHEKYYSDDDGRAVYVKDVDVLVEFFPSDWALPSLPTALSPEHMTPVIDALGLRSASNENPPLTIEVLQYRPHRRAVLAYRMNNSSDTSPIAVAKVYRSINQAQESWDRLNAAYVWLAERGVSVPRPLQLIPELNLFIMKYEPGSTLSEVLNRSNELGADVNLAVRRAAWALSALHSHQAPSSGGRNLAGELQQLRSAIRPVEAVRPDLGSRVGPLMSEVARRAEHCVEGTNCLIHGDFTPSQLLLRNQEVVVLDFDLSCAGDPAIDVANFLTKLRRRARQTGKISYRNLADRFLSEYECHAKPDAGFVERVRVLENIALVRSAIRAFRHHPFSETGPSSLPHLFLDEAQDSLDGSSYGR